MFAELSLAVAMLATAAGTTQPRDCWTIRPDASQLVLHVRSGGLLAFALHDHHFVPQAWTGRVCFDPENPRVLRLQVTVQADSLENRQAELSAEDLRTVDEQVRGPDILDVARHPTIRFEADDMKVTSRESGQVSGVVLGRLSLRGETGELHVPIEARWSGDRLRATGTVRFEQSRFGIEPYRRFAGTVSVRDEVELEFAIDASPEK